MQHGLTTEMIDSYKRFAAFRDSLDRYGYSGATTTEKRNYTRLLNKAVEQIKAGTTGTEDPLFRLRWASLPF